jgi:hypothetical protein
VEDSELRNLEFRGVARLLTDWQTELRAEAAALRTGAEPFVTSLPQAAVVLEIAARLELVADDLNGPIRGALNPPLEA